MSDSVYSALGFVPCLAVCAAFPHQLPLPSCTLAVFALDLPRRLRHGLCVHRCLCVSACQHERVFCGTGMDGLPLVIKVVYVDSRERWVYEKLVEKPKLRMVPKVALLPQFAEHKGRAVCAVVMSRLRSLSEAIHDPALVRRRDGVVAGALISQLLQVDWPCCVGCQCELCRSHPSVPPRVLRPALGACS